MAVDDSCSHPPSDGKKIPEKPPPPKFEELSWRFPTRFLRMVCRTLLWLRQDGHNLLLLAFTEAMLFTLSFLALWFIHNFLISLNLAMTCLALGASLLLFFNPMIGVNASRLVLLIVAVQLLIDYGCPLLTRCYHVKPQSTNSSA